MVTRLVSIFSLSCTPPPPFQTKLQTLLVPCREELPLSTSVAKATQQGWKLTGFVEHSPCAELDGHLLSLSPSPHSRTLLTSTAKAPPRGNTTPGHQVCTWLGRRGGKPQRSPCVSPWCLGTWASVSRAGTWLGHSRCWGAQRPAKGTRTWSMVFGRLGHLPLELASPGHQKFHMHGQNANTEWMHSWILLPIPSPVSPPCCHVPLQDSTAGYWSVSKCSSQDPRVREWD